MKMKRANWHETLNCAIEGILDAAKKQKKIKYYFIAAVAVLSIGLFLPLSMMEFAVLAMSVTILLFAEMINTAVRYTINLMHEQSRPQAKVAKDTAAGGVLIASIGAVVIGYMILSKPFFYYMSQAMEIVKRTPDQITIIAIVVVIILVVLIKARTGKGRPLYGGMPSGHAAVSFSIWTAVSLITMDPFIAMITLLLALMASNSRIVMGIHSTKEVMSGGLLGFLVTLLFFQIFG